MGFFEKLKAGLKKTKDSMMSRIERLLGSFTKIDEDLFEELEETLIMCDIGVNTSVKICEELKCDISDICEIVPDEAAEEKN